MKLENIALYLCIYLDAIVGKSSFSSKSKFSSSKTFGDKSEDRSEPSRASERDEELSLSEIEKKLLLLYPGESKHLDDSQVYRHTHLNYPKLIIV